jgi:uncharacterized protein (DUF488 family)
VGHSTRDLAAFLDLLAASSIELVADVRRFPGSTRHPQYNEAALAESLRGAGVAYRHFAPLGGRRSKRAPGSPNTGWRVEAFNAFADYMATPTFETALEDLTRDASARRTALMCSEAVPWRCHRRLISDALIVRGWTVWSIIGSGRVDRQPLTDFARVEGTSLVYPAEPLLGDAGASP